MAVQQHPFFNGSLRSEKNEKYSGQYSHFYLFFAASFRKGKAGIICGGQFFQIVDDFEKETWDLHIHRIE